MILSTPAVPVANGAQVTSTWPSPGVTAMLRIAGMAGGAGVAVGPGVAATVNVQVASWSATATALPAWAGVSNTTCGQSNVAPLTHGGMSRVIRRFSRPVVSAPFSFGPRPIQTGSNAIGEWL